MSAKFLAPKIGNLSLPTLYQMIHRLDAQLIETPQQFVGGRRWKSRLADRQALRLAIDNRVRASRRG